MGDSYSYVCKRASNIRPLETVGDKRVVLADLQFEDEHGHDFSLDRDVLVALDEDGDAEIVQYPEDVLLDEADDAIWDKWEKLCEQHPGPRYGVDNEEEFSELFA